MLWNPKLYLLVLGLSFAVTGCSLPSGDTSGPALPTTAAAADKVFVKATTPEERALRLCFGAAIIGEVWKYRLDEEGATRQDRDLAASSLRRMHSAAVNLRLENETIWFETEMFYAVKTLIIAVEAGARQRLMDRLGQLVMGSYTPLTFLRGLKVVAGQAALTNVMMADVRRLYERADFTTSHGQATAWGGCTKRIQDNLNLLQ